MHRNCCLPLPYFLVIGVGRSRSCTSTRASTLAREAFGAPGYSGLSCSELSVTVSWSQLNDMIGDRNPTSTAVVLVLAAANQP